MTVKRGKTCDCTNVKHRRHPGSHCESPTFGEGHLCFSCWSENADNDRRIRTRRAREARRAEAASLTPHVATYSEKQGRFSTLTDEEVPPYPLYRYVCSCGHAGQVWYADRDHARRAFHLHAEYA